MKVLAFLLMATQGFLISPAFGAAGRFFLEGDGSLHIVNAKTGVGGEIHYRANDGSCPPKARRAIDRTFRVPRHSSESISLRLIALLDYLQDHFEGRPIRLLSGYRSPEYNRGLRKKGRLAAKTSLHIEGMAADIEMEGVDGKTLWEFVRRLNCCGAGYYHGKGIHIDTGPPRFWDERTTGVEKDLGAHNKLILLRTDQDIYQSGESVRLGFFRITDYPIGVRSEAGLLKGSKELKKVSIFREHKVCSTIRSRHEAHTPAWTVPRDVRQTERIKIRINFCQKPFPEMPDGVESNPIQVHAASP